MTEPTYLPDDIPFLVFLDTEAYYAQSFDWTSALLNSLKDRVRRGSIRLISTEIVKQEIGKGISKRYDDCRKALKAAKKSSVVMNGMNDERIFALADLLINTPTVDEVKKCAWDYFEQTQTEIIPLANDAAPKLFDLYFSGAPPFGDGKKKSEFPDAANMLALLQYAKSHRESIYVVSGDKDWRRACDEHDILIHVRRLSEIIDKSIREEWKTDDAWAELDLLDVLRANKSELFAAVETGLRSSTLVNAGDGDLEELDIDDVALTGLALTDIHTKNGDLELHGELFHDVTYSAHVSIYDDLMDNDLEEDMAGTESVSGLFCLTISERKPYQLREVNIDYFDGLNLEVAIGF